MERKYVTDLSPWFTESIKTRNIVIGAWLVSDEKIKKSDLSLYGWDANPYVFVVEFELLRYEKFTDFNVIQIMSL